MAIHISDLPPKYQKQAMEQVLAQQHSREAKLSTAERQSRGRKYHNTPTERVAQDGTVIRFDSQKEARRYDHLILRLRAGEIRDLRLQVDFTLQEAYTDTNGHRIRATRYRADFVYECKTMATDTTVDGVPVGTLVWVKVVEDVKSRPTHTKDYALKRKMMKDRLGIDICEV